MFRDEVLRHVGVVRVSDRILRVAGALPAADLRSLDAIHLATAKALGGDLSRLCTYDARMADAAAALGITVTAPR